MSFLKISSVRIGEAARKRKIRSGDILLAIDGYMFTQDTKELKKKFEDKSQAPWLLTFKRGELIFDVFFDEPLKSDFDITTVEETEDATAALKKHKYAAWQDYKTYEVYRDISKKAEIVEITQDPFAGYVPPIWMLQNKLYYPFASVLIIYGITFIASFLLCLLAIVLVGVYTHRAQISLKRSYCLFDEKFLWFVTAVPSELSVVEKIMILDPDTKCKHKLDKKESPSEPKLTKVLPQPADYLT
jgi:hypothetical protein